MHRAWPKSKIKKFVARKGPNRKSKTGPKPFDAAQDRFQIPIIVKK